MLNTDLAKSVLSEVRVEHMVFFLNTDLASVTMNSQLLSPCSAYVFFSQHGLSKCDYEFTLSKSVLSICFSVLNTDFLV
jgi:hypothetical protein